MGQMLMEQAGLAAPKTPPTRSPNETVDQNDEGNDERKGKGKGKANRPNPKAPPIDERHVPSNSASTRETAGVARALPSVMAARSEMIS